MSFAGPRVSLRTGLWVAAVALISASAVLTVTAGNAGARPAASPSVTKTVTVRVAAPSLAPYAAARLVKPLAELRAGDRVLYAGPSIYGVIQRRQRCRWVEWYTSIDFATINCGAGDFTVKTAFLTPVEPRRR